MHEKSHAVARCLGAAWLCAGLVTGAWAQASSDKPAPSAAVSPGDAAISAQLVRTGLYLIQGGGGNSLLRLTANGAILVDGKRPDAYRAMRSQIRKISKLSDLPVRVMLVTNHHENHAGNSAAFLADGVVVIAQDHAKARLADARPPAAQSGTPLIGYDRDYTLRLGGVEVQVLHFGVAQTDGDAVVFFPNLKVVAVGDLYVRGTPQVDAAAGGDLAGWAAALEQILKLDFDVAVPSQGPAASRADLVAFKAKLEALAMQASAPPQAGTSTAESAGPAKPGDRG